MHVHRKIHPTHANRTYARACHTHTYTQNGKKVSADSCPGLWLQEDCMTHTSPFMCYEAHPATPESEPPASQDHPATMSHGSQTESLELTPTDAGVTDWPGKEAPTLPTTPTCFLCATGGGGVIPTIIYFNVYRCFASVHVSVPWVCPRQPGN